MCWTFVYVLVFPVRYCLQNPYKIKRQVTDNTCYILGFVSMQDRKVEEKSSSAITCIKVFRI